MEIKFEISGSMIKGDAKVFNNLSVTNSKVSLGVKDSTFFQDVSLMKI